MTTRYDDGIPELTPDEWAKRNPLDVISAFNGVVYSSKPIRFVEGRMRAMKRPDGDFNGSYDNAIRAMED